MIQGGDPTGTGTGGPGYKFRDELEGEGTYSRGTVAMANAGPNTNGSQFFICHADVGLPHSYTIFGAVTDGHGDRRRDRRDRNRPQRPPDAGLRHQQRHDHRELRPEGAVPGGTVREGASSPTVDAPALPAGGALPRFARSARAPSHVEDNPGRIVVGAVSGEPHPPVDACFDEAASPATRAQPDLVEQLIPRQAHETA